MVGTRKDPDTNKCEQCTHDNRGKRWGDAWGCFCLHSQGKYFATVPVSCKVISATRKRSKRSRGKIGTHQAHCTSSAGPGIAPSRAPQQVPNPGVINTPLSRQAPACAVPWGSLSLHELLVPKSAHPTLSIKIMTVYPSSTIQEELFCRMFLFQYKVKHHWGSFVPRPWLWEKRLCRKINSHWA